MDLGGRSQGRLCQRAWGSSQGLVNAMSMCLGSCTAAVAQYSCFSMRGKLRTAVVVAFTASEAPMGRLHAPTCTCSMCHAHMQPFEPRHRADTQHWGRVAPVPETPNRIGQARRRRGAAPDYRSVDAAKVAALNPSLAKQAVKRSITTRDEEPTCQSFHSFPLHPEHSPGAAAGLRHLRRLPKQRP